MIAIQMQGIGFSVNKLNPDDPDGPIMLLFTDPQSGISVQIPFDSAPWKIFKRHVEMDGEVPQIQIAQGLNGDIPHPNGP